MNRLVAFIGIYVEQSLMDEVIQSLSKLPNMEELYEETGEYDIFCVVSASDIEELRDILNKKIMKTRGVKSLVSSLVLNVHKGPRISKAIQRNISSSVHYQGR